MAGVAPWVPELLRQTDSPMEGEVVMYFGAQWCSACRGAQQSTQLSVQLGQRPLVYVSFDIGGEAESNGVQAVFPTYTRSISGPDDVQRLIRAYRVRCIPAFVVVNAATCERTMDVHFHPEDGKAAFTRHDADAEASFFTQAITRSNEGDLRGALAGFSEVLQRNPAHADAAFNVTALLQMAGHSVLAVHYIARFLDLRPNDRTGHVILGTVLAATDREAVIEALRDLVQHHPDSPWAAHRLACLTGEGDSAVSAQPAYVREVFDDLADSFESKLVDHLHYRIPWQLLDAVKTVATPPCPQEPSSVSSDPQPLESVIHANTRWWRVVDLGCGTGLCGRLFSEYTGLPPRAEGQGAAVQSRGEGLVIGVDLSPKMAEITRQTGAYDEVKVEDVHDTLARPYSPPLGMVLSADTFIYVGQLERVFSLAAGALARGTGLFAFSIELFAESMEVPAAGFKLVMSGRYAHTEAYIQRLADSEGFRILVRQDVTVRTEQTKPIAGIVYVLRRE